MNAPKSLPPGQTACAPRLSGRFDTDDPAGPRFAWSGSAIAARFSGSRIAVCLRASSDHFGIFLDGLPLARLAADPSREYFPLASGLREGVHEILISKLTEPLVSESQFLGFELDRGGQLLPPPPAPARRIELVGDSITAGFGVLGPDASCPFSPASEDFSLTYGAVCARALRAEPIAVAWSGRGVFRNYADEPGEPMPVLYERTLPARPDSRWDFSRWAADVVVVNLGTNDFSSGIPPRRPFVAAYTALLRRIRSAYPAAPIFCALGPMLGAERLDAARTFLGEALQSSSAAGLRRLRLIEFEPARAEEGLGCDGHPSRATHQRMAVQLTAAIKLELGWE